MAAILLVEDDTILADCLSQWLASAGHTVVHAADAQSAIDRLDDMTPQLIILDMLLPGANGVQVLHTLQSHADLAEIPVIVCSSVVTKHIQGIESYGVKKVIDKTTLDRSALCAAVGEVLG